MKTINELVKEFMSLKDMHLIEINRHFNSSCSCDWCAYIVDELFYNNFGIRLSRSCTKTRDILNQRQDFIEVNKNDLKIGDVVLYDWDKTGDCDHIGIICEVDNNKIKVCEGNIKSTDYTKSIVDIVDYDEYRQNYTTACFRYIYNNSKPVYHTFDTKITFTECDLNRGHKADKLLCQAMLYNYGYYSGLLDGVFGQKTIEAIQRFQSNHHIAITGVVDYETWKNLIELI